MAMYEKNLTEDFRLRLSKNDMDFLRELSACRAVSVSECVRSIIAEYRRSQNMVDVFSRLLEKGEGLSNGDTKTDLDDLV